MHIYSTANSTKIMRAARVKIEIKTYPVRVKTVRTVAFSLSAAAEEKSAHFFLFYL